MREGRGRRRRGLATIVVVAGRCHRRSAGSFCCSPHGGKVAARSADGCSALRRRIRRHEPAPVASGSDVDLVGTFKPEGTRSRALNGGEARPSALLALDQAPARRPPSPSSARPRHRRPPSVLVSATPKTSRNSVTGTICGSAGARDLARVQPGTRNTACRSFEPPRGLAGSLQRRGCGPGAPAPALSMASCWALLVMNWI
jgi:hypothetical protein